MGNSSKRDARKLKTLDRHAEALRLRVEENLGYQAIAERLGYAGRQGAKEAVVSALETHGPDPKMVERERAIEEAKLDAREAEVRQAIASTLVLATAGDLDAVLGFCKLDERRHKISERRAKLLGLDRPTKVELTGKDGDAIRIETSADEVLARITAHVARQGPGEAPSGEPGRADSGSQPG